MKSRYLRAVLNTVLVLLLVGVCCVSISAGAATYDIRGIDNRNYEFMFFEPNVLRIAPGDSVSFHVTHFDHQPQSVFIPEGARHWRVDNGESLTVTLTVEGVYIFDCFYHNVMGMAGVIVVGDPVNLEEARRFFGAYKQRTFAMNRDRLDRVWERLDADQP